MTGVLLRRETPGRYMLRKGYGRTQQEGSNLQAKERPQQRSNHFDPGLTSSRTVRKEISVVLSHPVCGSFVMAALAAEYSALRKRQAQDLHQPLPQDAPQELKATAPQGPRPSSDSAIPRPSSHSGHYCSSASAYYPILSHHLIT